MQDRPYQAAAHKAIRDGLAKGTTHQLIQMATGTGKTVVFSQLPEQLKSTHPGKMLVLAHRSELIDQAIAKMRVVNPFLRIDKEMAEHHADPSQADVIVASVATLGRRGTKRLSKYDWSLFDKYVVDEAHHSVASSYLNIFEAARLFEDGNKSLLLGVTATPSRGDGQALAKIFQKITYTYAMRQAIEDGWLVEPHGYRVKTGTSLDKVKISQGDYDTQELSNTVNTPQRNQLIVKAWLENAQGRPTVGFSVDIQHAKDLAAMFVQYGIKAEAVWGVDPDRADKIARHKSGETTVLFNCGVLSEGYDDPQISCIILAGPTKSPVKFTQMVGRGTRLHPGKIDTIILDIVDASSRNSLVTLPTLMGMSASLDLKGQGVVYAVKKLEEEQKKYPQIDFTQLADISTLDAFIENVNLFEVKFAPEVEGNSELSWYPSPTGGYVLILPNKDRLSINQNLLDKWSLFGTIKEQTYQGERDTIEQAFLAADNLVNKVCPDALKILRREEKWHKNPASGPQLKLIAKLYKGKAIPPDLSSGQASKLISARIAGKS